MVKALIELVKDFDVVSFDIFDTLLLRPFVKPTDLFWKIEQEEGVCGFAKDRINGERSANARALREGRVEATFDEIYSEIPQWAAIKSKELAAEERCLTANPEMALVWKAAKECGKRIVVTSDMYLPRDFLEKILANQGFAGWDGFYLSNELQAQKRTGKLFECMLKQLDVRPDNILHIGDNHNSDIVQANKRGIIAYEYPKIIDRFYEECPFVKKFIGAGEDSGKRFLVGALAAGWHRYKYANPDWTYWNRIGYLFSGVAAYMYMKFVGEDANQNGIEKLLFCARDGYILEKVCNILYPGIKTLYFQASRVIATIAMQYYGTLDHVARNRRQLCLSVLAEKLGIKLDEAQTINYLGGGGYFPILRN